MSDTTSTGVPAHLPGFITPPGETDTLLVVVTIVIVLSVFAIGVVYFKLHALPERMSHGNTRGQYQLVAILALIALFTHNNLFWIAALLLAAIQPPDFLTPITSIASSLRRLARASEAEARQAGAPPPVIPPSAEHQTGEQ